MNFEEKSAAYSISEFMAPAFMHAEFVAPAYKMKQPLICPY
jgi:hypothetical protein